MQLNIAVLLILLGAGAGAHAAGPAITTEHLHAELVAHAPDGVRAGAVIQAGMVFDHQPGWHTYWKNPGDSGLPTSYSWTLPGGVTASEIVWPTPHKLPLGPLMNYGYPERVLLPVNLTLPAGFKGDLPLQLHAEWLVCKEICVPESADLSLTIPASAPLNSQRALFDAAAAAVPTSVPGASALARLDGNALAIDVTGLPRSSSPEFIPEQGGVIDHAARTEQRWVDGTLKLRVPLSAQRSESPAQIDALLVTDGRAVRIAVPTAQLWPAAVQGTASSASAPQASAGLLLALAGAFVGGMLLNLMPCVFPVLSLKLIAFTQHGAERRRAATGGLAYSAGVVLSFVLLAGVLLALRGAGQQLGWGFQLQSPLFVSGMAALFTLIGLNLAGVFEFGNVLPSSLAGARMRYPLADDFLSGALAVAVASPCSAPFMGAAIGAALALPAWQALAVFASVGVGMAAPYLLACLWPGLARLLPRPGAWMVRFKHLMAYPMFASVVWLAWVLGRQSGIDAMAALLAILVALAYLAWSFGAAGPRRLALPASGVAVALAAVLWAGPLLSPVQGGERWQSWSASAVDSALAQGRPVFVDFTAAWCVTCQFNKRTALADASVLADFDRRKVVLLRADWTSADPAITRQLAQLGRSGVPVYALYGAPGQAPQVLSEILSAAQVRAALARL